MPNCPFSRERLAQIRWGERWPLAAIAAVATANSSETITPEIVLAWCEVYGISATPPPKPEEVLPSRKSTATSPLRTRPARASRVSVQRKAKERKLVTRPCAFCGADVTRYESEFTGKSEICYCNREHRIAHDRQQMAEKVKIRKAAGPLPELAIRLGISAAEKLCHGPCGLTKPIASLSVDVNRGDGRARICLECNKAKSRDYYARNRERQITKAQANKVKKRVSSQQED